MNRLVCLVLLLVMSISTLSAQVGIPNQDEFITELRKRGISEQQFRKRMIDKGFDIDNFDPLQFPEFERAAEQSVRELEAEIKQKKIAKIEEAQDTLDVREEEILEEESDVAADASAEEIAKLTDAGVPLEEAIARVMVEKGQEELPEATIYGQHIFRNKDLALYTPSEDIRPPDNYVLGAGDKITILIWGVSQENATFEINQAGYIKPHDMPRINLKGVPFLKAKELIRSRYDEFYNFRPEDFEVTIDYSRTITVNILGEAINAGSINVPARNTAFNALAAANGPTNLGSVRNIKLIHSNGESKQVDIYEFLLDPSRVKDFFLQNNDYIFIPVAEKLIKIDGAINRPFTYELLPNEGMKKLIQYAGGLKENAYLSNIQVKRFENDKEVIVDVNWRELQSGGGDFRLQKGDEVYIKTIPKEYDNFATIEGAVDLPGRYEILRGMRISDLIEQSGLAKDAKMDVAYLQRLNPDRSINYIRFSVNEILQNTGSTANELIEDEDKVVIFSQTKFMDNQSFVIAGAVRDPGNHPYDFSTSANDNIRVDDAIIIAGGLTAEATNFAYIHRLDPNTKKLQEYIRIDNLSGIMNNPMLASNITLQPFDSLVIYDYRMYLDKAFVKVDGAVRVPGQYKYDETLTLKDALTLSGGLKLEASLTHIDISRLNIQEDQSTKTDLITVTVDENFNVVNGANTPLHPYDLIYVRRAPEFEFQRSITIKGEVVYPGKYPITKDNEKVLDIIKKAEGYTDEAFPEGATLYRVKDNVGYVVMALDKAKAENSPFNYLVKAGDIIDIPKKKDFVSIKGATGAKKIYAEKIIRTGRINVPFHAKKDARWYVDEYAAGIAENGRRRLITVEHPNGQIEKTKNYIIFKSYPEVRVGSIITVGRIAKENIDRRKDREEVDWAKVLGDAVGQAGSILTLILLLQQVN